MRTSKKLMADFKFLSDICNMEKILVLLISLFCFSCQEAVTALKKDGFYHIKQLTKIPKEKQIQFNVVAEHGELPEGQTKFAGRFNENSVEFDNETYKALGVYSEKKKDDDGVFDYLIVFTSQHIYLMRDAPENAMIYNHILTVINIETSNAVGFDIK
jgi:hypothetical protein